MLGFCEFAEAFMMTNGLLRIPPSPCKQGEAWLSKLYPRNRTRGVRGMSLVETTLKG